MSGNLLRIAFGVFIASFGSSLVADEYSVDLKPVFKQYCFQCHSGEKIKGKVDLGSIGDLKSLISKPKLIENLLDVIDYQEMPPEEEPQIPMAKRNELVSSLKRLLVEAIESKKSDFKKRALSRLNRFQYNNAVRDLFDLKMDVFELPEKMMIRQANYLNSKDRKMPDRVRVVSNSRNSTPGMKDVNPFPKDLRAAHGFDNQQDQLTLSPLLLDSFLKLSVSILESPDFNRKTVGKWTQLFEAPENNQSLETSVRQRLSNFMPLAFRSLVDRETIDRYVSYALNMINKEKSFELGMKKTISGVLSSPLFLFRHETIAGDKAYRLASDLSFMLWGSGPDHQLLKAAESGKILDESYLRQTFERMINDPKIQRFLDSFPSQWMQLENALAATPDPNLSRYFSIDKDYSASLTMVLEPLLLFDAVFLENRSITDLISPSFAYQNEFLKTWYSPNELKPAEEDFQKVRSDNESKRNKIDGLTLELRELREKLFKNLNPIRNSLLESKVNTIKEQGEIPVDLSPVAFWKFDENLDCSISDLNLKSHGKISFEQGSVVLNNSYLESPKLPFELHAKTLEAWIVLDDLKQRGGGVMTINGPGAFDSIVLGERMPKHWISGSNGFARTEDFVGSKPEVLTGKPVHLAMTYSDNGKITLFRNGEEYGTPYEKRLAFFPAQKTSVFFGLRHPPAGEGKYLAVKIKEARLYDRALSGEEVSKSMKGMHVTLSNDELISALTENIRKEKSSLEKKIQDKIRAINKAPKAIEEKKLNAEVQKVYDNRIRQQLRSTVFERVSSHDPRYGGVITNAAMLSMTSGPKRSHPIARGAWIIEVILNDPPPPPPNDVPPLKDDRDSKHLTVRERFAQHRENPDCAGCHSKLDPLGFAMENFDLAGRWREKYPNGREVDSSGKLMRKHQYQNPGQFKNSLLQEKDRLAKAFIGHLMRFSLSRELEPEDSLVIDEIIERTKPNNYQIQSLIREVVLSGSFR